MRTRVMAAVVALVWLASAAAAQEMLVDLFIVKVKPEKRAVFEAVTKKFAEANRKTGDRWIASETVYGEHGWVYFWSLRPKYGAIDEGMAAFEGALAKAYGPAGMGKLFGDFSTCIESERGEIRRTRPDLSRNYPGETTALNRIVAEAKYYRSSIYHIRPGRVGDFENLLKMFIEAYKRTDNTDVVLVSQSNVGQHGNVFYSTQFAKSLGDFDKAPIPTRKLLGDDGYRRYQQTLMESVASVDTMINKLNPALSAAPDEIVKIAPAVWNPKPPAAAPAAKKTEKTE